ncbi:MAG: glycosyltransferase family 39 protein [Pseudomonadota bacterium]|nr:glycosyltransferase family 39 protein [Pseudomonadota bacterium]
MNSQKKITKIFYSFILSHLLIWTLIPSISNVNLPLDTIEALAWGSNLDWGFNKHPPFSAFAVEVFFSFFGSQDWAYYLLSQIFIIIAFIYVWKLSNEIFKNKIYSLLSLLALEGIFFYNFTTPEFNVNVSQLPFFALTSYFLWRGINSKKNSDWILFGIFSAFGFLSKYLFIYFLFSIFLFLIVIYQNKKIIKCYILSIIVTLLILTPHLFWLFENNFITIFYGLNRSGLNETQLLNHLINPIIFISKQIFILIPFFLMIFVLLKKISFRINIKSKKILFLLTISFLPFLLVLLTSFLTGAKIRTMWMTPFYLYIGTLFFEIQRNYIDLKKLTKFYYVFLFFFFLSPVSYLAVSVLDKTKRTDYPGKEISRLVQNKWDDNFINEIKIVVGDEWSAGNLSYHLTSRPLWIKELKNFSGNLRQDQGVIYTGNPKVLKKICPGVYGTIKPVGYCMIGKR